MAQVLVIEDDQRIRELVCQHLAAEGHSVSSDANGLEGLRSITADPPDVLVLDLGLPDLDGIDLLRMVRSVADLPVLVLTAREDEGTILAAFAEGADELAFLDITASPDRRQTVVDTVASVAQQISIPLLLGTLAGLGGAFISYNCRSLPDVIFIAFEINKGSSCLLR